MRLFASRGIKNLRCLFCGTHDSSKSALAAKHVNNTLNHPVIESNFSFSATFHTASRIKLPAANENKKQQLQRLSNAFKGIPQMKFTTEELHRIMDYNHNIHNMSVIAHGDHGLLIKTVVMVSYSYKFNLSYLVTS